MLTHFDTYILKLCENHEISFVCLVPNTTHISQLLDVAFYGPLMKKWRKILKEWKLKNHTQTALSKGIFPALLKQHVSVLNRDNLKSGFRSCGIYPFNPDALYSKLPENVNFATENEHNTSVSVLEHLKEMHRASSKPAKPKRNCISMVPEKIVSVEDVAGPSRSRSNEKNAGPSQSESDETSSSETESDSSSDEDEKADTKSVDCAQEEVKIDSKILGQWVIVEYEK